MIPFESSHHATADTRHRYRRSVMPTWGSPAERTQRWRGSSLLTLVPTGIDDAAPGPRQATP